MPVSQRGWRSRRLPFGDSLISMASRIAAPCSAHVARLAPSTLLCTCRPSRAHYLAPLEPFASCHPESRAFSAADQATCIPRSATLRSSCSKHRSRPPPFPSHPESHNRWRRKSSRIDSAPSPARISRSDP